MMKVPSYTSHNGFLMPLGFPSENFETSLNYDAEMNDIFVCTFPKCGTTLMQHIIYLLLNDGTPIKDGERLDQIFPHLEEVGSEYIKVRSVVKRGHRLIKTHLPYHMTPISKDAKYIFVSRNPKDCVVSFYHHTLGFPRHYQFEDGDFNLYFDLFMNGKVDFGDYFNCLKSFLNHRNDPNVFFVTYENLLNNKEEVVLELAKFIDKKLEQHLLEFDSSLMKKVLFHSSIDEMKKYPLRWCSFREDHHTPFIRKGKVGGWSELLSEEQAKKMDEKMKSIFTVEELELLGNRYYDSA